MTELTGYMFEGIPDESLACLNTFPEGTIGHERDKQLISLMNSLCKHHGYGMISWLANNIEEIWSNPEEGIKKWQAFRDERMQLMNSAQNAEKVVESKIM